MHRKVGHVKRLLVLALAAASAGCSAKGFDQGALRERLADQPVQVTEADIRAARDLKPQLAFPFRLGVYLEPAPERQAQYPNGTYSSTWHWTDADKDQILSVRDSLIRQGIVSDMFLVPEILLNGNDLHHVRLAAARSGADAVLVMQGASQVDEYQNPLGVLYLTLVGFFIVPGTNQSTEMMIQGAMWDVGNGYLYATVENTGEDKTFGPLALLKPTDSLNRSKTKALEGLAPELTRRLQSLYGVGQTGTQTR